jgi:hypothetical protein
MLPKEASRPEAIAGGCEVGSLPGPDWPAVELEACARQRRGCQLTQSEPHSRTRKAELSAYVVVWSVVRGRCPKPVQVPSWQDVFRVEFRSGNSTAQSFGSARQPIAYGFKKTHRIPERSVAAPPS